MVTRSDNICDIGGRFRGELSGMGLLFKKFCDADVDNLFM